MDSRISENGEPPLFETMHDDPVLSRVLPALSFEFYDGPGIRPGGVPVEFFDYLTLISARLFASAAHGPFERRDDFGLTLVQCGIITASSCL